MLSQDEIKKKLGNYAVSLIPAGATFGMGTGSTVYWLIRELAEKVKQGFPVKIVPTSSGTRALAAEWGITSVDLNEVDSLPLTLDGADEIDDNFNLIKGGGGALLQEKLVAAASKELIILADESKPVRQLGKFPLPVEVIPAGWKQVQGRIKNMGCHRVEIRKKQDEIFITDNGLYILDCYFEKINDAPALDSALQQIPGVAETGLFINMTRTVVIGFGDGRIEVRKKEDR